MLSGQLSTKTYSEGGLFVALPGDKCEMYFNTHLSILSSMPK